VCQADNNKGQKAVKNVSRQQAGFYIESPFIPTLPTQAVVRRFGPELAMLVMQTLGFFPELLVIGLLQQVPPKPFCFFG